MQKTMNPNDSKKNMKDKIDLMIAQSAPITLMGFWKDADLTRLRDEIATLCEEQRVDAEERLIAENKTLTLFQILGKYGWEIKLDKGMEVEVNGTSTPKTIRICLKEQNI